MTDVLTAPLRTAAQMQAERWFLLAQHLQAHPHLPAIDEIGGHHYLSDFGDRQATALADWADTLDDATIEVETAHAHPLDGGVIVTGGIGAGACTIQLSSEVRGLSATVGLPDPTNPVRRVPVTSDDLRTFDDTHHPLPITGDLLPPDPDDMGDGVDELA